MASLRTGNMKHNRAVALAVKTNKTANAAPVAPVKKAKKAA